MSFILQCPVFQSREFINAFRQLEIKTAPENKKIVKDKRFLLETKNGLLKSFLKIH